MHIDLRASQLPATRESSGLTPSRGPSARDRHEVVTEIERDPPSSYGEVYVVTPPPSARNKGGSIGPPCHDGRRGGSTCR